MQASGTVAAVAGLVFSASSVAHAAFNDVYDRSGVGRVRLLHLHYAVLLVFAACTAFYAAPWLGRISGGLANVLPFWLAIHGLRLTLDLLDGGAGRTRTVVVRHAADALANIATVAFVLAVSATGDRTLLWVTIALSAGMVGKEFFFRTVTDIVRRPGNVRKTSQQGSGRASPRHFVTLHLLSNTAKSTAYMLLGFGLSTGPLRRLTRTTRDRSSAGPRVPTTSRGRCPSPRVTSNCPSQGRETRCSSRSAVSNRRARRSAQSRSRRCRSAGDEDVGAARGAL